VHQDLTDTRAGVPFKPADPLPPRPCGHVLEPAAEIGIAAVGEGDLVELVEKFLYVQKGNLPARRQSSMGTSSRDLAFGANQMPVSLDNGALEPSSAPPKPRRVPASLS
jgi:hypothetical protein